MTILKKQAKVNMVDRALSFTGVPVQFDPPLEIVGTIIERSYYFNERLCVAFDHENSKYTVWKDVSSGEITVLD